MKERQKIFSPAVRLMLLATFCFALMNVLVKLISHIPAVEIVFFRAIITLVISFVMLKRSKVNIWGNNRKVLFLRGLFGSTALTLFFVTIQNIPLATASLIHYLKPIFTALIASMVLREKIHPLQWFFFALSFIGIFIIKGFDSRISLLFLSLGVFSAISAGAAYNCIRYLKGSEHPVVIVMYFPLVATPITGVLMFWTWVTPSLWDLFLLLTIGILTQIAQVLMTKSYQLEEASKIASVSYSGAIYALMFGFVFFNESFNFWVLVGMLLVILGVLLNLSLQNYLRKKVENKRRKVIF